MLYRMKFYIAGESIQQERRCYSTNKLIVQTLRFWYSAYMVGIYYHDVLGGKLAETLNLQQ